MASSLAHAGRRGAQRAFRSAARCRRPSSRTGLEPDQRARQAGVHVLAERLRPLPLEPGHGLPDHADRGPAALGEPHDAGAPVVGVRLAEEVAARSRAGAAGGSSPAWRPTCASPARRAAARPGPGTGRRRGAPAARRRSPRACRLAITSCRTSTAGRRSSAPTGGSTVSSISIAICPPGHDFSCKTPRPRNECAP